LQAINYYIND